MSFNRPDPAERGFGRPAPHDPFTRRMTNAERSSAVEYVAGNGPNTFGKLDPKTEAVTKRQLLDDTFGNGSSRRPGFGQPGGMNIPAPPNPLDQQSSGSNTSSDGPEKRTGLTGRLWDKVFKEADQVQKDSQTFNQQGRMADSFVAEHNARQQSAPGFGGQSFGQSFGQPKNDGPQMGF